MTKLVVRPDRFGDRHVWKEVKWTWLFMSRMINTLLSIYRFSIHVLKVSYKRDRLRKRSRSDITTEMLSPKGKMALQGLREPRHQPSRIYRILSKNGILITVMQNLHFQDFVTLTHTSRYFQHLLLGPTSLPLETIRIATCTPHSKFRCWACNTQICIVSYLLFSAYSLSHYQI